MLKQKTVVMAALAGLAVGMLPAKTCTWISGTADWTNEASWQDGLLPEDGDDVVFAGNQYRKGATISLKGGTTPALKSLTFNDTDDGGWNLSDGTLTVHPDGAVFTNSKSALTKIPATIAGGGDLVKRGNGTLSLSGENTFTGRFILEDGRLQLEADAAFGPEPAEYRADAIVLKGGILGSTETNEGTTIVAPNRGITIDGEAGAGEIGVRSQGLLRIQSPIVGAGDLRISRQSGTLSLEAPCSYTGRTILGYVGAYYSGNSCLLTLSGDGALPATTTVSATDGSQKEVLSASIYLNGTTQRVAGIEAEPKVHLMFWGNDAGGTFRFGTAEDTTVAISNIYVTAGATLAYAGAGTLTPGSSSPALTTAAGTTLALESGRLSLSEGAIYGAIALALGEGTQVVLAEGMTGLTRDLVLNGSATIASATPTISLAGNLTRTVETAGLAIADGNSAIFGANDYVLRLLNAPITAGEGQTVTLEGWIDAGVDPTSYAKTEACVIFGTYSDVTAGNLALDGQTRGIKSVSELGNGTETISLANGSRLVIAAEDELSASYTVMLDATSTLELGGTAAIDLSAASITGAGTVKISDTTVRLPASTEGLSFAGPGAVDVPEGQAQTLVWTGGSLEKVGAGTLVLTGTADADMTRLTVAEGTVRLNFTGGAKIVGNVDVRKDATLVLDGDEQINDANYVVVNGMFDLNGHTERILCYQNTPEKNTVRESPSAAIVNRSSNPAKLTAFSECPFFGRITEEPGRIDITQTSSNWAPVGLQGGAAPSSVTASAQGTVFPYTRFSTFRFVFYKTLGSQDVVQLSEIQLTCQGKPIPVSAMKGFASSGTDSKQPLVNLADDRADTYWASTSGTNFFVDVSIGGFWPVDGYRLAANTVANAPMDWDVYAFRADPTGWFLVDRRRGERIVRANRDWTTFDRTMSTNYLFSAESRPRSPVAPTVAVSLQSKSTSAMRVSSVEPVVLGSMSGSGSIRMEDGSTLAPADLTDWTGAFTFQNCNDLFHQAHLQLTSERGPAAQPIYNLTATNANIAIENGGTQPVSVLVDDSVQQPLRGRLVDGNGPLGLVKRGSGSFKLGTGDCANTGVTAIEEGTLKVCGTFGVGRPVSARYLRIWPTKNNSGNDSNGFNWGMNEFQILKDDGSVIPFPSGTSTSAENGFHSTQTGDRLIDGDISTRTLVWNTNEEKTAKKGYCSWVVIDMKQVVSFDGYCWYTAHNNSADQNRVPVAWTIEISADGVNWSTVDVGSEKYSLAYGSGNTGYLRGPYALRGEADGVQTLATIPAEFFAETTIRSTRAPALKARYFKFQPHETYDPTYSGVSYGWMLSEFALFKNGERVDWPVGTTPTLKGGGLNTSNGSSLQNICDNEVSGSTEQTQLERVFVTQMPSYVTIDAGSEVVFDAYGFYSAAGGGNPDRIPTAWTVSVSADGTNWTVIDEQIGRRNIVRGDYKLQGLYSVADRYPLLGATTATDALGDASPVAIAAGAALSIDSDYEKFGTLSGSGTLAVNGGAVAEVNACVPGTFSGTVTGIGTLAVCGVATQTFDNAAINVAQLELNGGTVVGTATRTGDLAVAFKGGAWAGTLAVSGTLAVTGTPVFTLPSEPTGAVRQTLFTYTSIDADSAALLKSAEIVGDLPPGMKAKVLVGATSCILSASADGTVILFR